MIRSIPNPPMDREDVARFHRNLEKHLRGDFSADERHRIEERKARTESITKRIIANCGGKTQYSDIDIQIRMMTDADYENMSAFSCGVDELDKFFRTEVKECVERRYLSAYCAYTESHGIVAAFTLMNDSIMIGGNDEKADFFEDLRLDEDENIVDFSSNNLHIRQSISGI